MCYILCLTILQSLKSKSNSNLLLAELLSSLHSFSLETEHSTKISIFNSVEQRAELGTLFLS